MKKLIFVTLLLFLSIFLALSAQKKSFDFVKIFSIARPSGPKAQVKNHTFSIDVAKQPEDREIGLSKYNSLQKDKGMYFIFDKPDLYAFWMKNMKFPIDIIFLNSNTVVDIKENVPAADPNDLNPPRYIPKKPANAVLEISAGLSKEYEVKVGDIVTFSNLP